MSRSLPPALLLGVAMLFAATPAHAKPHSCPAHQTWSVSQGACIAERPPAPPRSPQKKYDDAVADLSSSAPENERGDTAALADNCARANHGPSCTLLGYLHERGRAVANDPTKAMELFVKACGLGDVEGCYQVGDLAERVGLYAEARGAYSHACEVKSGLACVRGGDLYRGDSGGQQHDANTATQLYLAGLAIFQPDCPLDGSGHNGAACYALGYLMENGYGAPKDGPKAVAAYRSGCTIGSADACVALGNAFTAGLAGAADPAGATEAYKTACDTYDSAEACAKLALGIGNRRVDSELAEGLRLAQRACLLDAKQCGTEAEYYRIGLGVPVDNATATTLYKQGCDAGAPGWCTSWAQRAHEGTGTAKDVPGSIAVAQKACDDGDSEGCRVAAGFLAPTNAAKAEALARKGCERGDGGSCYLAGSYAAAGKQLDLAFALYEKACEADSPAGCASAADAYTSGTGVAADAAKAQERMQKACIANDATSSGEACENLVVMFYNATPKDAESAMYSSARACALGRTKSCAWLVQLSGEVPGDHADIRELVGNSCKGKNDAACVAQANLLLAGNEADKTAGFALLETTCARDVDDACLRKADALNGGFGTLPQPDKAKAIYTQYCVKGAPGACLMMSIFANEAKDYTNAMTFAKRGCELGNADACQNLGYFYFAARGVIWDAKQGVQLWQKACELGSEYGCLNMGHMYRYGMVVPKDDKKSAEAYAKACTPAVKIGCEGVGFYEKDPKKAAESLRTTCEAKDDPLPLACSELADLLERTHDASAPEIARLRQLALALGIKDAPNNAYRAWMLGTYYRDGVATVKDPAKAREWFEKSCENYDPLGCLEAGKSLLATGVAADAEKARKIDLDRACIVGINEACDLEAGHMKTPGGGVHAKGCGCETGGADGGWLLALLVAVSQCVRRGRLAMGSRRRRRRAAPRDSRRTPTE